jgi:hypothetical protein
MATLLNIPPPLLIRPATVDLCLSWSKYQAYLKAHTKLYQMIADGMWTLKKPTTVELVEVFVSKSVWHGSYSKLFSKVKNYSLIQKWLESAGGAPSNLKIFGVEKQVYMFKDLKDAMDGMDEARTKKGKRKVSDSALKGASKKKVTGKGKERTM